MNIRKIAIMCICIAFSVGFIACESVPTSGEIGEEEMTVPEDESLKDIVEPEIEMVEEPKEKVDPVRGPYPEFVLFDDTGNYYQPQHVSLDDIYKRIEYATEKYNGFSSDWDRDRFVCLLIYNNGPYMDDEDVKTLYWDYLGNFGKNHYDQESWKIGASDQWRKKIDYEDCFIDKRIAEEAKRYYEWYYATMDQKKIADYYMNEIHPTIDYSNPYLYTTAFSDLMDHMVGTVIPYDGVMPDEYFDNNTTMYNFKCKLYDEIIPDAPILDYDLKDIKDYVSSHKEK